MFVCRLPYKPMSSQPLTHRPYRLPVRNRLLFCALVSFLSGSVALADEPLDPEATLRTLMRANAERDLDTMSKYMSHDVDAIGYTIDGRKYVGWPDLAADMRSEFDSVVRLEIPVNNLHVWTKGDIAWFAMESDYIRYIDPADLTQRMVLPLRETGVLEKRDGRWILVAWHESTRHHDSVTKQSASDTTALLHRTADTQASMPNGVDLSGEWEVTEIEDNKKYVATLDTHGNGPYTWQGGQFSTTIFVSPKLGMVGMA